MPCTFALKRDSTEAFSGVRRTHLSEEIVGFGLVLFETGNLLVQGLLSVVEEHRLIYTRKEMTTTSRRLRNASSLPQDKSAERGNDDVGFVEPELHDSTIVTGQRMEDPPSVKVKKEFGVFTKASRQSKNGSSNNNESSNECEERDITKDGDGKEQNDESYMFKLYKNKLTSRQDIEEKTMLSSLRLNSTETKLRKRSGSPEGITSNDPTPKKLRKYQTKKRRNIDSIRESLKKISEFVQNANHTSPLPEDEANTTNSDATALNNDYCSCCGMTGMFLCCESCPKSYHFQCINPPVDPNNLPEFWYCKECLKKKVTNNRKEKPISFNVGIFSKLFDTIVYQDPLSFQIPKEIIESFQDISTDRLGDYNDASFKPQKSYKQLVKEHDDPLNGVYDKDGNPYYCYKCGDSGLNKEIINCDYCTLSWHLDCLDPPMTNIKKLGSKWKCPNHVDTLITKPIRKFKDQEVIPISNIRAFESSGKLPMDANIEIINVDEKLKKLKERVKELHDNNNASLRYSNLTFQISEENIILDFINSSKIRKLNEADKNMQLLMNLDPTLRDYISSLSQLSDRSVLNNSVKRVNLQKLLKVSDDELKVENNELSKDELRELLSLKRLIDAKGKDKLVKFLTETET